MGGVLAVMLWRFAFHDDPPPDDAALQPQWSARGGDANPLAVFCREIEANHIRDDYAQLPDAVRKCESGTEATMREFVQRHAAAIEAFEKLMATDTVSWQWPGGPHISDIDSQSSIKVSPVTDIMQPLRMKVHLLCVEGRNEDAANMAMKIIRYGRGMQHSEGSIVHILIAITAEVIGQDGLKQALSIPTVSAARVQSSLEELRSLKGLQCEEYQFALRADYLWFKNAVGQMDGEAIMQMGASDTSEYHKGTPAAKLLTVLFKPNRTLTMRCDLDRPIVEGLSHGWTEGFNAGVVSVQRAEKVFDRKRSSLLFYLDGNVTGKVFNSFAWVANKKMLEKAVMTVILHDQTELMLALRLFELEHSKLPERLEELVPAYLDRVPEDHFSGRPMSWKPKTRVVYSIGIDQKDDGGTVNDDRPTKGADIGRHYWWSAKQSDQIPK